MVKNKCPECGRSYEYRRGLSSHFDDHPSHTPETWFDCPSCDKSFETEQAMKSHHTQRHGVSIVVETRQCEVCSEEVRRLRDYDKAFCSGKCRDEWQSENWSGEDNPAYSGSRITIECEWCGSNFDVWGAELERRRFCSKKCMGEWRSENWTGEQSPVYTGYSDNYGDGWYRQRRRAREKYDGICQSCGVEQSDRKHDVHHIVPVAEFDDPEDAHDLENLTLLCRSCHQTVEYEMSVEEQKDRLK